jgi:UDP-N-acetylglucosamine acyltransferase
MGNRVHATAIVGDGVELGDGNVIGPYTVLLGPCRIGHDNWIGPHVTIGTPAEYRDEPHPVGWAGEQAGQGVHIGHRNRIREHVTVHQGARETTRIGDDCYLLAHSHVGHDCRLGDEVTLSCAAQLGGHTHVWSHATAGMGALVHQHSRIGPGAMLGMGAVVRREVLPFTVTVGNPARTAGMNEVGLRRLGCTDEAVTALASVVTGRAEPSDVDLPDTVAALLKLWTDRSTT